MLREGFHMEKLNVEAQGICKVWMTKENKRN